MNEIQQQYPEILMFLTFREGPWTIQIHTAHTTKGQQHIHLSRKKLRGEYAWNIDGTRHDKHKFPNLEQAINAAKKIGAKRLGIDLSILRFVVAEPIVHRDFSLTVEPQQKNIDKYFVELFLPDCNGNDVLLVCETDNSLTIHVVIVRITAFQLSLVDDSENRADECSK
jgi:hypothetical protein